MCSDHSLSTLLTYRESKDVTKKFFEQVGLHEFLEKPSYNIFLDSWELLKHLHVQESVRKAQQLSLNPVPLS